MHLREAIGFRPGEMVSLIGAGGKTTTLFRLAEELCDAGGKVLVTTTTKMFKPTKPHVHRLFLAQEVEALIDETSTIPAPVIIGAGYGVDDEDKLLSLPPAWLDALDKTRQFDGILVEADGAASRLFKVPSEIEPVVPETCHVTLWVMSIKILEKPVHPNWVHRAERAAALLGVPQGTAMTCDHIFQLVQNPVGCLKGVPSGSRKIALINQADSPEEIHKARDLARGLVRLGLARAVVTSYLTNDPVKEVLTS